MTAQMPEAQGNLPAKHKKEPKRFSGIIPRRKPADIYGETMFFMGLGLREFEHNHIELNRKTVPKLRFFLRNYCINNGIRGKHKAAMERIVVAQIQIIKGQLPKVA